MKSFIQNTLISVLMLCSFTVAAELPSWGMTENQYKLPNFSSKMSEIGAQATKNNWLLKVTAPKDWHATIRNGLTNTGERDVQMTFKDSLYQSIAITAVKGAKVAKISSSSSSDTPVQKQVIIDKPEIDTEVEAPDFGDTSFENNNSDLLEGISNMQITVPPANGSTDSAYEPSRTEVAQPEPAVRETAPQAVSEPVVAATPAAPAEESDAAITEENKEDLRKRYARTKRVEKEMSYANITSKDDLYIQGDVVLIKRFVNQGVVIYFWMQEAYDPAEHKLIEKGSGKYQKDPEAVAGDTPKAERQEAVVEATVEPTELNFVAVDTNIEDQDDLRRSHARNKRIDLSIVADQLKEDDILYVLNQTVLVERPLTSARSTYFWLVGDTTITRAVERIGDDEFLIK
ncbi:hypothetical protein [Marinicella meishanensis]|uniref:hypothetical protein n=1 Tax=Marinicella meishanensis TaxID=2873263 RepID=UPI001CC030BF|nr:hypothetical protein [Marinicella sp. NBU2979]